MQEQWKAVCKLKDIAPHGARAVPRGFAWQELPSVALLRGADDAVHAVLDVCPQAGCKPSLATACAASAACPRHHLSEACAMEGAPDQVRQFKVKIDDGRVYLDLNELSAPASRAEAALAGAIGLVAIPALV